MKPESGGLLEGMMPEVEVALELRVSVRTVIRWRVSGVGPPYVRLGKRVFYKRQDVAAWLARQAA